AYDAIVAGARGLFFFGGHLRQVMTPADRARGWNWTYWQRVQRLLLGELTDADHRRALVAPTAQAAVPASPADIAHSARRAGRLVYLIAIRKSRTGRGRVRFSGLPASITHGTVLAHPGGNPARGVTVARGAFTDPSPFAPHNARVYRFQLRNSWRRRRSRGSRRSPGACAVSCSIRPASFPPRASSRGCAASRRRSHLRRSSRS